MDHSEFLAAYRKNPAQFLVHRRAALEMMKSPLVPGRYRFSILFFLWLARLVLLSSLVLAFLTSGFGILLALLAIPIYGGLKISAQQFVMSLAQESPEFYLAARQHEVIRVVSQKGFATQFRSYCDYHAVTKDAMQHLASLRVATPDISEEEAVRALVRERYESVETPPELHGHRDPSIFGDTIPAYVFGVLKTECTYRDERGNPNMKVVHNDFASAWTDLQKLGYSSQAGIAFAERTLRQRDVLMGQAKASA